MPKTSLPTDSAMRKDTPMCTGVLDYFPDALAYVARISKLGNDKHNPGEPLHWAEGKSMDHPDCIMRHLAERDTFDDDDGALHEGKLAWRALANLQTALKARVAAGKPLWDEETISRNKRALEQRLSAGKVEPKAEQRPKSRSPHITYDARNNTYMINDTLMAPGFSPAKGDIALARAENRYTEING